MTSYSTERDSLSKYLNGFDEPITPELLARILGYSLATVRIYKSRQDLDPVSYGNILPKPLPPKKNKKKVLYTRAAILEWWLDSETENTEKKRGRPTIASKMQRGEL